MDKLNNTDKTTSYILRSTAYIGIGNYLKALDDSVAAIQMLSESSLINNDISCIAHNNKAVALSKLGFNEVAIKEYNKALHYSHPVWDKPIIYSNISITKNYLELYNDAIAYCNKAIEEDAKFAPAYSNRGLYKAKLNLFDEAISDCVKAIELDDTIPECYIELGYVKALQGCYNEALDCYNKAIEIDTTAKKALPYILLGIAKYKLGQYNEAVEFYNKTLELKPQDKVVKDNIIKLKSELASVGIDVPNMLTSFTKRIEYTYTKEDYKQIRSDYKKFIISKSINIKRFIAIHFAFIVTTIGLMFLLMNININPAYTFCIILLLLSAFPLILLIIIDKPSFLNNNPFLFRNGIKNVKASLKINLLFDTGHIIFNNSLLKEYYTYLHVKKHYELKETKNYIYLLLIEEFKSRKKFCTILFALPKKILKNTEESEKTISIIKNYCGI